MRGGPRGCTVNLIILRGRKGEMDIRNVPMFSRSLSSVLVTLLLLCAMGQLRAEEEDIAARTAQGSQSCNVLQHKTTYKQHLLLEVSRGLLLLFRRTLGGERHRQEDAPTDITGLFNSIYDRINEDLDDVVSVQITYVGDVIHRVVGEHDVQATVTRRSDSGKEETECMFIPVEIEDTNECTLPRGHAMRHECHPSARCINTIGSFECVCPDSELCVSGSGRGLCSDVSSTAECCAVDMNKRPHGCRDKTCESDCRRDFRCYTDQCEGKCVYPELCHSERGMVTCRCKDGKVGNGHKCPGETPTIYKDANGNLLPPGLDASTVCGCQEPVLDLCHDVTCGKHASCRVVSNTPVCECQAGFREVPELGCVDDTAPSLVLNGPAHMSMKQCDKYVERGVQVLDANSENTDRNVGVSYSQPPGRCSPEIGTFTVNYTLNTEWTYPAVQFIVRSVTIEDVDECSLDPSSPQFKCPDCAPRCHRHARCENRVGSYTCSCPMCMSGDGFQSFVPKKSRTPVGFVQGSGCTDVCPPVITLQGDQTVVLEVGANTFIWGEKVPGRNLTDELKRYIADTNGSAFCDDDSPGSRCAKVLDNNGTHQDVDLSHKLLISAPVKVSEEPPKWHVTYNAQDEAGNYATPVVRTVQIKEVTPEDYGARQCSKMQTEMKQQVPDRSHCPPCKRCPECPRQQQQQSVASSDQGRGKPSCRDCPCGERADCMARSECVSRQSTEKTVDLGPCSKAEVYLSDLQQIAIAVIVVAAVGMGVMVLGAR